jgi:hypothetical protein
VVAAGMLASVVLVFGASFSYQVYVDLAHIPDDANAHRAWRQQEQDAYAWVRQNVPQDAAFYASLDPLLYLYTGHAATSRPLPPRLWYHEDTAAMIDAWADVGNFARSHNLSYYFGVSTDLGRNLDDEDQPKALKALQSSSDLSPVYKQGDITIYRVLDAQRADATAPSAGVGPRTELPPSAR